MKDGLKPEPAPKLAHCPTRADPRVRGRGDATMDHRKRDYEAEDRAAALPRHRATLGHPLDGRWGADAGDESSSASTATGRSPPLGGGGDPLRGGAGFADPLGASGDSPGVARGDAEVFDDPLRANGGGATVASGPMSRDERASEILRGRDGDSRRARDLLAGPGAEDPEVVAEWESRKVAIHARFSGQGTVRVSKSFDIISTRERGLRGIQARLDELNDPAAGQRADYSRITVHEYVTRLKQLNEDIAAAWQASDRINALKLSIQAAKLLRDSSVPKFFPVLFVLVCDILDTIGRLVFERIRAKAERDDDGELIEKLPEGFTCDDVREEAKVTCRNWFRKIASVQELVPRVYMEIAILRCYHFLQKGPPVKQLERLIGMCRGVGDPLVAAYLRAYLAHKGSSLCGEESRAPLMSQLSDFLPQYGLLLHPEVAARNFYCATSGITRAEYLALLDPAVDWILRCCARRADVPTLKRVLELGGDAPPPPFLKGALRAMPSAVTSANAEHIVALIGASSRCGDRYASANEGAGAGSNGSQGDAVSPALAAAATGSRSSNDAARRGVVPEHVVAQADCYRLLGEKLVECPPRSDIRLAVLREVWAAVRKCADLHAYLRCADAWSEYVVANFGQAELDALLRDAVKHLEVGTAAGGGGGEGGTAKLPEKLLALVENIAFRVLTHRETLADALALESFVPLTDFLHGSTRRYFFRRALELVTDPAAGPIRDPVALHFAFEGAKVLHDALDGMSADSDRREATRLTTRFIRAASFGRDYEAHLNFLTSCRGAFYALSDVQEVVVLRAARLAVEALRAVKGKHSNKTLAFVKATIAFCQITAPSVAGAQSRLRLFLAAAEAALMNGLVQQADGLVRSAITDAQESTGASAVGGWRDLAPGEADAAAVDFVRRCASLLVVLPGHPEKGPLYIVRGLARVMETFPWSPKSDAPVQAHLALVQLCAALAQPRLPYRVEGVQSNDSLYAGEPEYAEEVLELTHELVQRATDAAGARVDGDGEEDGEEGGGGDGESGKAKAKAKDAVIGSADAVARMARANLDLANVLATCCRPTGEIRSLVEAVAGRAREALGAEDAYQRATEAYARARLR